MNTFLSATETKLHIDNVTPPTAIVMTTIIFLCKHVGESLLYLAYILVNIAK